MRHLTSPIAAALLLTLTLPTLAADKTQSLGHGNTLHYNLPDGWSADATGPTLKLTAPKEKHLAIQITLLPSRNRPTDADLKKAADGIAKKLAQGSVEKTIEPEAFKGDHTSGYLCSATDAAADPGEFKRVTTGVLAAGDSLLAVTLLYNDKDTPEHTAALATLKSLNITTAPAAAPGDLHITTPDPKVSLLLPGKWTLRDDEKSHDGKSRQLTATDDANQLIATIFLEPAAKPGDAKAAREFYLARMQHNPIPMTNLKKAEAADVATLTYDQDINLNAHAYLSRNGTWIDIHISKASENHDKDRPAVEATLTGIKLEPAQPTTTAPAK